MTKLKPAPTTATRPVSNGITEAKIVELFRSGQYEALMKGTTGLWLHHCKPHSDFATVLTDEGDNEPMSKITVRRPAAASGAA